MHTTLIKLVLVSAILFSCKPRVEKDEPVPENLLNEEQLVIVLADSYLAEGASGINIKNVSGNKYDSTYLFNPFKENKIDKTKFDSTMAYYTRHPLKMKAVYEKVLERLSVIQANGKLP